jgi:hypothetical protein
LITVIQFLENLSDRQKPFVRGLIEIIGKLFVQPVKEVSAGSNVKPKSTIGAK